jgi:hypothetical protein
MLGVEPVSGSTVSDYPTNYNLTLTLTGKVLTAFKGIIGDTSEMDLTGYGWRLKVSQAPFAYFAATYHIAAQAALHVQQSTALEYLQGFSPPTQISLQARQGDIQIQKLIYNLIMTGNETIAIAWATDVELYISEFGPETIRGTIYVYEDTGAWMHIEEEEFTF